MTSLVMLLLMAVPEAVALAALILAVQISAIFLAIYSVVSVVKERALKLRQRAKISPLNFL